MTETLRIEHRDNVAILWLARPARRNALDAPMWAGLRVAAATLTAAAPRVVVLAGEGPHFCSGMDLSMSNPLLPRLAPAVMGKDEAALRAIIEELKGDVAAIAELPCPVIAAIEGSCLGGGLELALAADLMVAATDATFAMPETRWGMVPDVGGTTRLSRRIGASRAADLILSGRRIDGTQAEAWGLVQRSCAAGQALETALAWAGDIARNAPTATCHALGVLRLADQLTEAESFEAETVAGMEALKSGEVMEGMQAFATKRDPRW